MPMEGALTRACPGLQSHVGTARSAAVRRQPVRRDRICSEKHSAMRGILLDMDGVLYNSEAPIEGAARTMAWIQKEGIPHLFVTNTSSRGRTALLDKLHRFGIHAERETILTPCAAAAAWLRTQPGGAAALFINPKAREEFSGIPVLEAPAESGAQYVVIGDMGEHWSFRALNRAFRLLHGNPGATLIALGMTRFWLADDGIRIDAGPFVAALEYATGRKALVLGKPSVSFFRMAAARLSLPAEEVVMIGDDIVTDIQGAQAAGMRAVLLRTGKFRPADLAGAIRPDAVLHSIQDLGDWWLAQHARTH